MVLVEFNFVINQGQCAVDRVAPILQSCPMALQDGDPLALSSVASLDQLDVASDIGQRHIRFPQPYAVAQPVNVDGIIESAAGPVAANWAQQQAFPFILAQPVNVDGIIESAAGPVAANWAQQQAFPFILAQNVNA